MKVAYTSPGSGGSEAQKPADLASRVFNNPSFQLAWAVFLLLLLLFVSFPIQRVLLVFWVYGKDAYFHQDIRVIPRRPLRFSDGVRVAPELEIVTGAGMFALTTFGLSFALFFALRFYERHFGSRESSAESKP